MVNKANAFVCSFFILLSLLFRSTTLYAKDEALPVSDYVNDYAGIMSSGTKEELDALCLLYTSPSPRDGATSRMPSSA